MDSHSAGRRRIIVKYAKTLFALVIIGLVARHFIILLSRPELNPYPFELRIEYLLAAGLLYLGAHTCWAWFWVRLMRSQGVEVRLFDGLRAYFVSQFGKYVPGKAMVILIRVALLRDAVGSRPLVVGVTATYETLTSMGAGALVGLLLLPRLGVLPPQVSENTEVIAVLAAMPLVLGVLNKLAARRIDRMRGPNAPPLPSPSLFLLLQGLVHGACGWCLLGVSLGLAIRAVAPEPPAITPGIFLDDLGSIALAYTAGFFVLVAPGGLGVRELILQYALTPRFDPELAAAQAAVIALVLRLTWTIAELLFIAALYTMPRPQKGTKDTLKREEGP
ncbi:MAG TPA: lysylphosphatidylglycerol synthase domain-containing protein [Urbifossiella sp.]|nr:lysylphosphatidylglycerol synthase domain-containing protein [Urbifossiella sp.]